MNTTIRKVSSFGHNDHLVFFTRDRSKFNTSFLSKAEQDFINKEIKNEKKLIAINQYSRWIFYYIIERGQRESYIINENARKQGEKLVTRLKILQVESVVLIDEGPHEEILAFAEGMILGNYQFLKYRKEKSKETNFFKSIKINSKKITDDEVKELAIVTEATCLARDLVNEPQSFLTSTQLAKEFQQLGKTAGFKTEVYDKAKIKAKQMGGLIAVNLGSVEPPTFTIMEWKPKKPVNKNPVVLVGKAVVYDTGGLSLKPTANSMDYMKSDMAGGALVGAVMYALAKADIQVHVVGLVPSTDNRPGGNAYTPGDVITMYSGLTVEVLNTDAEGRLILADALHHAKEYNPELVMEFSTLTGAAAAAVGQYGIVCMGNASEKVKLQLKKSGNNVFERLAEFPFWEEYDELIKSDIADLKNIGGPVAGAITAGRFLQYFTDYPYMHFDIAGPSFIKLADSYRGKNATGVGVRFMFDFLKNMAGKQV